MNSWQNEYFDMLDDCDSRESKLSEWESDFIESFRSQLEDGKIPTNKQIDKLSDIWDRVTSNG